jgi:hypothetical protein
MSLSAFARKALVCGCLALAAPAVVLSQTNTYLTNGVEYSIAGSLQTDQVHPQLGLNVAGGYLVWEDTITDGDGLGISALKLDGGFSGEFAPFRVNFVGTADQEHPQVSLLNGGGAAFVWQGGRQGFQRIYARFLSAAGTWMANDILVNTFTGNSQLNPTVATLLNGNVVVAWASFNQVSANSLQDVYAQVLSPGGAKVGGEFLVNAFTAYNQRTPAVASLSGGGFVVVWVSEQERATDDAGMPSVDVYGRLYNASGVAAGGEFLINTGTNICANPSVAASSDGGFTVAWGQLDPVSRTNSWDVFARPFSSAGMGGTTRRVNTLAFGDQYAPRISATGSNFLVVWTSLGQDGSREGVYGQFLQGDGSPLGGEMRINTTVINGQIHPCVASDRAGRFLVAWSGYIGGPNSFDLFAQRYAKYSPPLVPMNAPLLYVPFVVASNHYQPQIEVFWAVQSGLPVDHYEVYVDGAGAATASVTTNVWTMTAAHGLAAGSAHSFQVAYLTADGQRSPLSPAASATTWGGYNYYGIPVEWMDQYWGGAWPPATTPLVPGGPTPQQVFLTGADPLDSATWLRTAISQTAQGYFLTWNPQPGLTYQVQSSSNLSGWVNAGSPRFAVGNTDSVYLGANSPGYYRILRLR